MCKKREIILAGNNKNIFGNKSENMMLCSTRKWSDVLGGRILSFDWNPRAAKHVHTTRRCNCRNWGVIGIAYVYLQLQLSIMCITIFWAVNSSLCKSPQNLSFNVINIFYLSISLLYSILFFINYDKICILFVSILIFNYFIRK